MADEPQAQPAPEGAATPPVDEGAPAADVPARVPLPAEFKAAKRVPGGVTLAAVFGTAFTLIALYFAFTGTAEDASGLYVVLLSLIVLIAGVSYPMLIRGSGWSRVAASVTSAVWAILLFVALSRAFTGEGPAELTRAWWLAGVVLVGHIGVVLYLRAPRPLGWFKPVDWAEALPEARLLVAAVFLVVLALSGVLHIGWQATPTGRESISGLVNTLLAADQLVLLLQLLGVLLVAALVAAVVLAMRDDADGDAPADKGGH